MFQVGFWLGVKVTACRVSVPSSILQSFAEALPPGVVAELGLKLADLLVAAVGLLETTQSIT